MKRQNVMIGALMAASVLRMSDAVDASVDDILSNDLSGVDSRNPLLPKGRYKFIIKEMELKEKDDNGKIKKRVAIQLKLNQSATSTDGQPLHAGTIFFDQIAITPTEKWTKEDIQKNLKRFQEAFSGVNGAFHPLSQYIGREVEADVTVSQAKGDYEEANRFRYVKAS